MIQYTKLNCVRLQLTTIGLTPLITNPSVHSDYVIGVGSIVFSAGCNKQMMQLEPLLCLHAVI